MQHNRSLKDLFQPSSHPYHTYKLQINKKLNENQPFIHTLNNKSQTELKHTKSQKNFIYTQRNLFKHVQETKPLIDNSLMPKNSNIIHCASNEPKKHKILKKARFNFHEEFKMGRILGQGRYGNVYAVQHNQTKSIFAAKQISLEKVSRKLIDRITAQIKIQSYLNHEHCLQLYKFYKQQQNIYLILELGEQSLFDLLREQRFFSERKTAYYIKQTIKALLYLHENGIIHRDLKPENIVLINNTVKLADFGWSIYTGKREKRKTFCGTLDYIPPQIVKGSEYDEMVDVWGVGVLCYELSTGHAPFDEAKTKQDTYKKILRGQVKFPRHLSGEIKDFIRKLLIINPQDRMSLQEALNHEWMMKHEGNH